MSGDEATLVADAFASNWIAPLGPHVDAFQQEFAQRVGTPNAVALSSGTAALHLALLLSGVRPGDDVFVSTLTFAASVNPICYLGASPVFVDCERASWNMDPGLLDDELRRRALRGRLPRAVVVVHLYGQSANLGPIVDACQRYGVTLIEDAAEALGATYQDRAPGTFGTFGVFSFNGNKIITTSGGGMLVTPESELAAHALKLATQARDAAPHYEHSEIGYNYRMSNVLAAIGRGQLRHLDERVAARRSNFEVYSRAFRQIPGIALTPEARWGTHSRWLTTLTIDPREFGTDRETLRLAMADENIEARPVWKPMHRQPVFAGCKILRGAVAESLFADGLCLPSGSNLTASDLERVIDVVYRVHARSARNNRKRIAGL